MKKENNNRIVEEKYIIYPILIIVINVIHMFNVFFSFCIKKEGQDQYVTPCVNITIVCKNLGMNLGLKGKWE